MAVERITQLEDDLSSANQEVGCHSQMRFNAGARLVVEWLDSGCQRGFVELLHVYIN